MFNRWCPEITGEIIWKSEAPMVGHRFTHELLAYIGPWFQNGGSSQKALVSDLQAWTYTILDCQTALYTKNTFFFFFFYSCILQSFWQGHMRCVCLEWQTDWIDCELSLFTRSWLRRRNVIKKSSVASATSSVALHGLPEADHCEQRIKYRTRNSEASYSIPSLTLDCG